MKSPSPMLSASTHLKSEFRVPDHLELAATATREIRLRFCVEAGDAAPTLGHRMSQDSHGFAFSKPIELRETCASPAARHESVAWDGWTCDLKVILIELGIWKVCDAKARAFAEKARVKVVTAVDGSGFVRALRISLVPPAVSSRVAADAAAAVIALRQGEER